MAKGRYYVHYTTLGVFMCVAYILAQLFVVVVVFLVWFCVIVVLF